MFKIYPSLMATDLLNLRKVLKKMENLYHGFHLDVMDFHFVENLTFGPDFINSIRKETEATLWVQLLVENPHKYLERLSLKEDDILSFHYEAVEDAEISELLKKIRQTGLKASLALNPGTPTEVVKQFFGLMDQVLLMSVKPGFSGGDFIPESIKHLQDLKALKEKYNENFSIAMDGGIKLDNLEFLSKAGANEFSIGSGIFGSYK